MLNTVTLNIGDCTNKVSFNTPSTGIIQKSNPKSNFISFHSKSELAEYVFSEYPRLTKRTSTWDEGSQRFLDTPKIVVLQIMVFGDNELLVEYVFEKDLATV
jgi:hypothetical protein